MKKSLEPLQTPNLQSQYFPLHQGPAASSPGPAASTIHNDEDIEYSDEFCAQSQDSGRTVLCPDLYVLTNDEYWTMMLETHKYVAATGSFCFVTTENGHQQVICTFTTVPCVQLSLYLNEVTNDFGNNKVEVPESVDSRSRDVLERCLTTC